MYCRLAAAYVSTATTHAGNLIASQSVIQPTSSPKNRSLALYPSTSWALEKLWVWGLDKGFEFRVLLNLIGSRHLGSAPPATQGEAACHSWQRSRASRRCAPAACPRLAVLAGQECMMTLSRPMMVFVLPVPAEDLGIVIRVLGPIITLRKHVMVFVPPVPAELGIVIRVLRPMLLSILPVRARRYKPLSLGFEGP